MASPALLILLALLSVLLTLSPLISKSKSAVLSSITIRFTANYQNYIFKTARKKGKVVK